MNGCGLPELPGFEFTFAAGPACREIGGLPNGGQQQQEEAAWRERLQPTNDAKNVFSFVRSSITGLRPADLVLLFRRLIATTQPSECAFRQGLDKMFWLTRLNLDLRAYTVQADYLVVGQQQSSVVRSEDRARWK